MKESKDTYHEQGQGGEGNDKYTAVDGGKEGVYNEDGDLVTDPVNMGTFNRGDPNAKFPVEHFIKDMVPYYLMGNTRDDPTTFKERLFGSYEGPIPK